MSKDRMEKLQIEKRLECASAQVVPKAKLRPQSPTNASTSTDCIDCGTGSASAKAVSVTKDALQKDFDFGDWLPSEAEADLSSAADEEIIDEGDLLEALSVDLDETTSIKLQPPVIVTKSAPAKGV